MTADEKPPARISHRIFTTSYLEMRIEMIKLVASDLDGTLLLNGAQSVEDSMFETIGRLLDRGILFAPASGRQMTSLKRLFAPVAEELVYISENGALVSYKGKTIANWHWKLLKMCSRRITVKCWYPAKRRHILSRRPKSITTE